MNMKNVNGYVVLAVVAVGAAWYLKNKAGAVLNAVNPLNNDNVIYKGVNNVVGDRNVAATSDYLFGAVDLLNPFNESDAHAKQVYGLDFDYSKWLPEFKNWTLPQWDMSSVNPASNKNVVYTGITKAVGENKVASVGDKIFAAIDWLNPFNESDVYAKKVLFGDEDYRNTVNNNKESINE